MIAPCGLDCSACDIFRAPDVPEIRERLTSWFKHNGWPQAEESWFHCCGCPPADKNDHWSADCAIMLCAQAKGVRYCSECSEFICSKLQEWANSGAKYQRALETLMQMRK